MVVFRTHKAEILPAYTTCPLSLDVLDTVHKSFAIGAFARFHPTVDLFIHDRPDFHNKPHHKIRDTLDAEGQTGPFLLLEELTEEQDAVWYITSTEAAEAEAENGEESFKQYEGETPLLRMWIKVADVPLEHVNLDIGNSNILEAMESTGLEYPYDPHAEQLEAFTLGADFETDHSYIPPAFIIAGDDEVEVSYDLKDREHISLGRGPPDMVVRLKEEVAVREGLKVQWHPSSRNEDGTWNLQTVYDPESEKWRRHMPLQR
ncbi:uncharacterized protein BDZ99DRAFT_224806 [Mytilinidion resinicola]|uniref:Uncharacterized protein n=1 Tax=Mytilinidion resinicola TaxID=574789 RepID=A0A6A6YZ61_9PEZI|nr:uncharacterized protein BDZ99DRAFT_224806 [Mytilinidion resinicola]KAF2813789.1 hypothetical protein BDZ99DRAFT_224806 [Mytilinidion resinicola]